MKTFYCLVMLCACLVGQAQCFDELRAGEPASAFAAEARVSDVLILSERAVRLVEPALPPLVYSPDYSLLDGLEPQAQAAGRYLLARGLLPNTFSAEMAASELWQQLQQRLRGWYDLAADTDPHSPSEILSQQEVVNGLARLSLELRSLLDPILLLAAEDRRADALSFMALIRLDGPYPRLIVLRPLEGIDLSQPIPQLFPLLNSCATNIRNYVYAPQATATRLFFSTNQTESAIVYSEPREVGQLLIPAGQEVRFFQFDDAALEGIERFSVVFAGESPGAAALIRMLPQLRTNLGARDILRFFD